jgi:predicted Ser/Thr protein kinase
VNRKEIENKSVCVTQGKFGKPDLNQIEWDGRSLMLKDVRERSFLLRWTLGSWLIHKEWKIYSRLKGVKGIPQPIERIDRFAFAMEFIPGRPLLRGETLPSSFFSDLEQVLKGVHARGVVHLDLRHKGNILLSDKGEPFLIDFNSSFAFKEKGFLRRTLFSLLCWVDDGGLLKLKKRVSPSSMTPQELAFLKRFDRIRKLWIFN